MLATDSQVAFSLLARNIERNRLPGATRLEGKVLDWYSDPTSWTWSATTNDSTASSPLAPPFDLIVTTDTIYVEELFEPLLKTIKALSRNNSPTILLALEERDAQSIQEFWRRSEEYGFSRKEIKTARLGKAVKQQLGWTREDWQGVRVYQLTVT